MWISRKYATEHLDVQGDRSSTSRSTSGGPEKFLFQTIKNLEEEPNLQLCENSCVESHGRIVRIFVSRLIPLILGFNTFSYSPYHH